MEITQAQRIFKYKDKEFADPNPTMTPKQVLNFYANDYPELLNASINAGEFQDNKLVYEIKAVLGQKG